MGVDWPLVRTHLLRHTLLAGGATTATVLLGAWYWEYPVPIAALGVCMLAVGALLVVFRDGEGSGRRRGLVAAIVPTAGGRRGPSGPDRALVYFLLGVLAFAGVTVLVATLRLKL